MKKRVVSLGLAAMMAMSMTACGGSGNASTSESAAEDAQGAEGADGEVFKIGGIGPITGAAGAYGAAVKNGTELAINEINEAGGINGYQVAFNFQDDENDPEKAINAYNTLKDGVLTDKQVWGLAIDSKSRIWLGGENEIAIFSPDMKLQKI